MILLSGLLGSSAGCRKGRSEEPLAASPPAIVASELQTNGLSGLPGAVYHSQVKSPIHWQSWTPETLSRAKLANRLVFAVVAMPQQPGFQNVLAAMAADPALVAVINDCYVPVLIDGDASREIGLLIADLCVEIKQPLQLPLMIWMSPDANPVAWIPVAKSKVVKIAELFNQSHLVVNRMWTEDAKYVTHNSMLDNRNRRLRLSQRKNTQGVSTQVAEDVVQFLRQLTSLYDSNSRSFDEVGGLFPAGSIDLMATAAIQPGLSVEIRARCLKITRELLLDLLPSAMFDPLDGGIFTAHRGTSWALPSFFRDCGAQARAALTLIDVYRATADPGALEKALGLIAFAEKSYMTSEGLFAVGMAEESETAAWLWSLEDIQRLLPPADAVWWIKATGMKDLGNLPLELDPRREYFRLNSLGFSKSLAALAADQSQTLAAFTPRFENARQILLKARKARLGSEVRDDCSHAGATFRMVSAYAAAFGVTGDEKFRQQAVALLAHARTAFSEGPRLRLFSQAAPKSIGAGRAFLYGLAMQAALDVSVITSDEKWLDWSEDLASTAAELFTNAEFLKECPDDAKIMDLPVTDLVMLFDDSTAGLISSAECRLAGRNRSLAASFSALATPLPLHAAERPILRTDLFQAALAREFRVTVVVGAGISAELKLAVERLPLRMFQRAGLKAQAEVPVGVVKLIFGNGESRLVSSPEALQQAVLPSLVK